MPIGIEFEYLNQMNKLVRILHRSKNSLIYRIFYLYHRIYHRKFIQFIYIYIYIKMLKNGIEFEYLNQMNKLMRILHKSKISLIYHRIFQ